jgi:predicted nucleic acid-binding protein
MGQKYLIDTNAIIDYLENKLPEKASNKIDDGPVIMSVISRIELLAWPRATERQLKVLENFISSSEVLLLSEDVIVKTIAARRSAGIKLPDAIIAATALVHNLTLLTRNTSDFKKIDGLTYADPYNLD